MSSFIEVRPKGAPGPVMVNLDRVVYISDHVIYCDGTKLHVLESYAELIDLVSRALLSADGIARKLEQKDAPILDE